MYGRPQPHQAYPRQYGQAYPQQQQQQQQYPPRGQPQQQYGQQYGQQYAPQYTQQQQQPQGAYPPQQHGAYPPQQQQPAYGAQYGGPSPPRGAYGQHAGQQPHGAPQGQAPYGGARGPSSYGAPARPVAPPAVSAYESQAQRWKKGFTPGAGAAAGGGHSRQSDIEAPLIAELCSSAGSSYPPRELLQKLLRHLPSLDHEYVCELLDDKLEDRLWQVQGKALSVLDALFKSQAGETYKTYYYHRSYALEALCNSRKELLKARAEKVFNVIRSHVPPASPSPEYEEEQAPASQPREQPNLLLGSPVLTSAVSTPVPPVNLLGSPVLMPHDEPAEAPPTSSAFGFLNTSAVAPPSPAPVAEQPVASAFSFMASSQPPAATTADPAQPAMTRVVAVAPVAAPAVDIFSSLPPPTPVAGLIVPQAEPAPKEEEEVEEEKVHDPIHDAFEGLNFDDDDEDAGEGSNGGNSENPLEGFSTTSRGTMAGSMLTIPVPTVDPSDPIREVNLEVDVPAGPMGLMLDRSIPHMAVVQGFLPMPTGERGYLEMHPVLCPGCALVSINSMSVEDKGLEEVGAILGSRANSYKVLRFKKLMRSGRTVNPANPDLVYSPPPPEKPEEPPVEEKEDEEEDEAEDGSEFMRRLAEYSDKLDAVEQQIEELVNRDRANLPVGDMKNQLAQLHGHVEKIQTQGIDSVILGANPPSNADEIRQTRSALVRRSDALAKRIQKILTNGTAPSPLVGALPVAIGSPEVSAFSFVGGAGGPPAMPSLQLPQPASAFSFMQSAASPVSSPTGAAPSSSAFSFLSTGASAAPTPAPQATNTVFAGLSLRNESPAAAEPPSAFSFMPGGAAPQVGVVEPPRVTSPTAFSFLRGAAASPPGSPAAAGPPGSAFSFIS